MGKEFFFKNINLFISMKAFDTVWYEALLLKLLHYGITGVIKVVSDSRSSYTPYCNKGGQ
jgi:hypothetical protein